MNPIVLITRIILTLVLPVLTTVLIAVLFALITALVSYTMGQDFVQVYQSVLKKGNVFIPPAIICLICTIVYWIEYAD